MTNAVNLASLAISGALSADANGNVGLGVVPNAWQSGTKAFEMNAAALWARGASVGTELVTNGYFNGAAYLYTNNGAAARYLQSGTTHTWYGAPSGTAGNAITFTPVMTVGTGVSLALENASSQTGTGITFPATQSASTNANTLDDYEEGTWTPAFVGATTNPTVTYSNRVASYVKIGRFVYAQCYLTVSTTSGGTGNLLISGLPFTSSASSLAFGGATVTWKGASWSTTGPDFGHVAASNTYVVCYADNNTNQTVLTPANLANGCEVIFSIWYQVD